MAEPTDFSDFDEEREEEQEEFDFSDFNNSPEAPSDTPKVARDNSFDWEAALSGGAEGLTYGFDDEIAGGIEAARNLLNKDMSIEDAYLKGRDERRKHQEELRQRSPVSAGVGEGIGSFVTPGSSLKLIGKGAQAGKAMLPIIARSIGTSDDADISSMGEQAVGSAGIQALIEGAIPAMKGTGKAISRAVGNPLDDLLKSYKAARSGKNLFGEESRRAAEKEVQSVAGEMSESLKGYGNRLAKQKKEALDAATGTTDIYKPIERALSEIDSASSLDVGGLKRDQARIRSTLDQVMKDNRFLAQSDPKAVNDLTRRLQQLSEKAGQDSESFVKTPEALDVLNRLEKGVRQANVDSVPGLGTANSKISEYNRLLEGLGLEKVRDAYDFNPKAVSTIDNKLQNVIRGIDKETETGIRARQAFDKLQSRLPEEQVGRAKDVSELFDLTRKAESGNLFDKSQVATGALVGKTVRGLDNMSNQQLINMANNVRGTIPGLASGLEKLATEKAPRARSALMFSLQQNPAYRDWFRKNGLMDEEANQK